MAGTVSQAAFSLAYARTATHAYWPLALTAGGLAFALSTLTLRWLPLSLVPLAVVAVAALLACRRLMPEARRGPSPIAPAAALVGHPPRAWW